MAETTYTLEELADAFGLTPRNARHWIEKILPPHHKKGRGALAQYGRDTFNCFAFVQKARSKGLTSAQIARVLSELGQDQVDRIAEGVEDLAVMPILSAPLMEESAPPSPRSASARARRHFAASEPAQVQERIQHSKSAFVKPSAKAGKPSWTTLYQDEDLQIHCRGEADHDQREQVRKAAGLIRSILKR
jgi:DNA-binding transcriptional MerR regulator